MVAQSPFDPTPKKVGPLSAFAKRVKLKTGGRKVRQLISIVLQSDLCIA